MDKAMSHTKLPVSFPWRVSGLLYRLMLCFTMDRNKTGFGLFSGQPSAFLVLFRFYGWLLLGQWSIRIFWFCNSFHVVQYILFSQQNVNTWRKITVLESTPAAPPSQILQMVVEHISILGFSWRSKGFGSTSVHWPHILKVQSCHWCSPSPDYRVINKPRDSLLIMVKAQLPSQTQPSWLKGSVVIDTAISCWLRKWVC